MIKDSVSSVPSGELSAQPYLGRVGAEDSGCGCTTCVLLCSYLHACCAMEVPMNECCLCLNRPAAVLGAQHPGLHCMSLTKGNTPELCVTMPGGVSALYTVRAGQVLFSPGLCSGSGGPFWSACGTGSRCHSCRRLLFSSGHRTGLDRLFWFVQIPAARQRHGVLRGAAAPPPEHAARGRVRRAQHVCARRQQGRRRRRRAAWGARAAWAARPRRSGRSRPRTS